uniref:Uncharacterized protein n=1 Tax=Oreochromis niloticus TaxID=8128 RepID=A0A669CDV8_ORENI
MSEPIIDPAEFERLKVEVIYLRRVVDRLSTKVESLTGTVLQLSTSVTALQRQPTPVSAEPRIGLPDKWNGVDGRPDGLLATLDMLFECQPTKYATARAKVAMLTSLLSGQAQEWAAALYNNKSAACNDYALFMLLYDPSFWRGWLITSDDDRS